MDCVAYSYTPVLSKLQKLLASLPESLTVAVDSHAKSAFENVSGIGLKSEWLSGQVMLGMAAYRCVFC